MPYFRELADLKYKHRQEVKRILATSYLEFKSVVKGKHKHVTIREILEDVSGITLSANFMRSGI